MPVPQPEDFRRDDYWVTIPAGKFLIGAQKASPNEPNYDADAYDKVRESPVHTVHLAAYRIARDPVTVWEYE